MPYSGATLIFAALNAPMDIRTMRAVAIITALVISKGRQSTLFRSDINSTGMLSFWLTGCIILWEIAQRGNYVTRLENATH